MTFGDSYFYPMNYHSGFSPASMMRTMPAQQTQPAGFPAGAHSGPTFSVPVVPMGTGQGLPMGAVEESFIENILRFNKGKVGTFYFTYQGNSRWNAMVYRGRVETAGRDHIIISDPASGRRYLLLMSNLDWVEFEEQINYPHHEISPAVEASLETTE
ncbi:spore coat protein [Mesobacillus campisalis]|uniref:Spore coat protein n=1 Tax=Mesobacillus campisalis TaxID=1408103 RepID=A0A0M2T037_9BACI|nr:spore coat protein GerQ [Mesobacillus campisalis]KKK39783.1 spore coat protein [Mesobacillus campisalis]